MTQEEMRSQGYSPTAIAMKFGGPVGTDTYYKILKKRIIIYQKDTHTVEVRALAQAIVTVWKSKEMTTCEQITDGHCCDVCDGAGGFESAASSTNYFWKTCQKCSGTGKVNTAKPTHQFEVIK